MPGHDENWGLHLNCSLSSTSTADRSTFFTSYTPQLCEISHPNLSFMPWNHPYGSFFFLKCNNKVLKVRWAQANVYWKLLPICPFTGSLKAEQSKLHIHPIKMKYSLQKGPVRYGRCKSVIWHSFILICPFPPLVCLNIAELMNLVWMWGKSWKNSVSHQK